MTPVSTCPKCGAPIYMPTGGNGTQLPMAQHTCMCRFDTHPAKTLTDEDLAERIEFLKCHGASERFMQVYEEAVKWAMLAILKKASEK